ncbi:MAG: hypothetical protein NUV77_13760 [Thermoguttaceae bacterium]|jgi:hypothetical protein|nr:hypothetical protein [Thermoguttaceae bacterium]
MVADEPRGELPRVRSRAKVALASIFLATILVAVVAAALRTAVDTEDAETLAFGASVGLLIGCLAAPMLRSGGRPLWANLGLGMTLGPLAGILAVSPHAFPAAAMGSAVLILFAAIVRRFSARPASPTDASETPPPAH